LLLNSMSLPHEQIFSPQHSLTSTVYFVLSNLSIHQSTHTLHLNSAFTPPTHKPSPPTARQDPSSVFQTCACLHSVNAAYSATAPSSFISHHQPNPAEPRFTIFASSDFGLFLPWDRWDRWAVEAGGESFFIYFLVGLGRIGRKDSVRKAWAGAGNLVLRFTIHVFLETVLS
jgi:hypothetical protein